MVVVMVFGVALRLGPPRQALRTGLAVALLTLLPIVALMIRQVRFGSWANVDASNRAERPLLFAGCMVALVALVAYAIVFQPATFLVRGAVGVLAMLAACALATRWVKVSLHMAFGALAATTLVAVGSPAGWFLVAALPPLAWSRLALGRHQAVEVAVGLLAGVAAGYVIVAV